MKPDADFIPALNQRWLTPLYDPMLKWMMREERLKRDLIERAQIHAGQRALDLGCGTGTLAVMIKETYPDVEVSGLDADRRILEIARAKAKRARVDIAFEEGLAYRLPYPDQTFDRVLSSLVLHHLTIEEKQRALKETFRVLRPGGEIHIVDFGPPHGRAARVASVVMRHFERVEDQLSGALPRYLWDAGFSDVRETNRFGVAFGSLSMYGGIRKN